MHWLNYKWESENILALTMFSPVAQAVVSLIGDPGVMSSIAVWPNTSMEIGHEIFSMFILLLLRIQKGLLSVTNENMCTEYC